MVQLIHARRVLVDSSTLLEAGGLLVEGGRIADGLGGAGGGARASRLPGVETRDLGDALLAPGLVNAHAHLDLTALAGRVSARQGFGAWVSELLEERAATSAEELTRGVRTGADRLLATGTSWVADIDTTRLAPPVLADHALGAVVMREVLDAGDPTRSDAAMAEVSQPLAERAGLLEGLSPHAPFTVSPPLFSRLGALAAERRIPVAIHWSETEAEIRWLADGTGPLAALLGESPRCSGLDLIEDAGLLGPRTALIHGNHPSPGEPARIAAAGATVIHCPGTHRFFGRGGAPLRAYLDAGVRLALGTDSLASNGDLDLRREMGWLREAHPDLGPAVVWDMATVGGGQALGLETGRLRPGMRADLVAFTVEGAGLDSILEELTCGLPEVVGVRRFERL